MTHLICKQILDLIVRGNSDPYALQQRFNNLYWEVIVPAIEKLFNELSDEDEIICMDRLELDLGLLDFENLDRDEIAKEVVLQLKNSIQEKLYKEKKSTELILPMRIWHFNYWLQWLENGFLPGQELFIEQNWQNSVLETLGLHSQQVLELQIFLKRKPIALQRLVMQHSSDFLVSLVELYTGHNQKKLLTFFKEIKLILRGRIKKNIANQIRQTEYIIWRIILHKSIIQRIKISSQELCTMVLLNEEIYSFIFPNSKTTRGSRSTNQSKINPRLAISIGEYKSYPMIESLLSKIADRIPNDTILVPLNKNLSSDDHKRYPIKEALLPKMADQFPNNKVLVPLNKIEAFDVRDKLIEAFDVPNKLIKALYFDNAGVILIHPFLSKLFSKLKLLNGQQFKSLAHQSKAIILIHYLATGETNAQDFHLMLPKLLCGMPFNQPMDHSLKLTKKEQKEADNLLQAALDHWAALGNVSIDSLREGFLIRKGKLEQKSSMWKLYLEHKPIDLLLDHLPWGLGLIRMPWMKEMLTVEWR
jgi:hypothetical protein